MKKSNKNITMQVMKSIRIPVAPCNSCHDSNKYDRKVKHKKEISHE